MGGTLLKHLIRTKNTHLAWHMEVTNSILPLIWDLKESQSVNPTIPATTTKNSQQNPMFHLHLEAVSAGWEFVPSKKSRKAGRNS